jgi:hypothetical protein
MKNIAVLIGLILAALGATLGHGVLALMLSCALWVAVGSQGVLVIERHRVSKIIQKHMFLKTDKRDIFKE